MKIPERSPQGSGSGRGSVHSRNTPPSLLHNKGLLSSRKDFPRALSQLRERHSSYPAHSSLPFSCKGEKDAKETLVKVKVTVYRQAHKRLEFNQKII